MKAANPELIGELARVYARMAVDRMLAARKSPWHFRTERRGPVTWITFKREAA